MDDCWLICRLSYPALTTTFTPFPTSVLQINKARLRRICWWSLIWWYIQVCVMWKRIWPFYSLNMLSISSESVLSLDLLNFSLDLMKCCLWKSVCFGLSFHGRQVAKVSRLFNLPHNTESVIMGWEMFSKMTKLGMVAYTLSLTNSRC